jgi:hypothetical protein
LRRKLPSTATSKLFIVARFRFLLVLRIAGQGAQLAHELHSATRKALR